MHTEPSHIASREPAQPRRARFTQLNRALAVARRADNTQDAALVGAAAFFGVRYFDVTPEQRASWLLMTSSVHYDPHTNDAIAYRFGRPS